MLDAGGLDNQRSPGAGFVSKKSSRCCVWLPVNTTWLVDASVFNQPLSPIVQAHPGSNASPCDGEIVLELKI